MLYFSLFATGLHALAAVVWVGGMVFAYAVLRPSAGPLEPPQRLALWARVFKRFFVIVWHAVVLLPATGYAQVFLDYGGFGAAGTGINVMHGLGLIMIALYLVLWFGPYATFKRAVASESWPDAGKALNGIRRIVGINTLLGLATVFIGASARFWG